MYKYIEEFFLFTSKKETFNGMKILEVGSRNVNGSLRRIIEKYNPKTYIGVDIEYGPGVDKKCNANELINIFKDDYFDVIICTEVLEHVPDWKEVISNIKGVLKPDGLIFISTRSKGFGYHGFPYDFWRYELKDFHIIFSDFEILCLAKDIGIPGVLFWGKKPKTYNEINLTHYKLWSIIKRKRTKTISMSSVKIFLMFLPIYKEVILPYIINPIRKSFETRYTIKRKNYGQ